MLIVSLVQIAKRFNINRKSLWWLITENNIPLFQQHPKILLDLDENHPFLLATRDALQYNLQIYYTLADLASILNIDPKTVKKQFLQLNIPIQNQENKGFVYSTQIVELARLTGFNISRFNKNSSKNKDN